MITSFKIFYIELIQTILLRVKSDGCVNKTV